MKKLIALLLALLPSLVYGAAIPTATVSFPNYTTLKQIGAGPNHTLLYKGQQIQGGGGGGTQGPAGPAGPQGPQGATGPAGPQGAQGLPGLALNWRGDWQVAPTGYVSNDAVYRNGSSYRATAFSSGIDPATDALYQYWFPVAVKGSKGDKGDKGDTGLQGIKGDKGDKGDTGATGLTGAQGVAGPAGSQGVAGPKGDKGDTGATGPQGPQGPQGIKGDAGTTDYTMLTNKPTIGIIAVAPSGGDDGAVINTAFQTYKSVIISGNYHITTPIVVPSGHTLEGTSPLDGSTRIYTSVSGDYSIKVTGTLGIAGPLVSNVGLKNFALIREGSNTTSGIKISAAANIAVEGVKISAMNGRSLMLEQVWDSWFTNGYTHSSTYVGSATLLSYGTNDTTNHIRFKGWTWEANNNTEIEFASGFNANNIYAISFDRCKVERGGAYPAPMVLVSSGAVTDVTWTQPFLLTNSSTVSPWLLDVTGTTTYVKDWRFNGGLIASAYSGTHPGLMRFFRSAGLSWTDVRFTLWAGTFASAPVVMDSTDDSYYAFNCALNENYGVDIFNRAPGTSTTMNNSLKVLNKDQTGGATHYLKLNPQGASGGAEITSDTGPVVSMIGGKLGVGSNLDLYSGTANSPTKPSIRGSSTSGSLSLNATGTGSVVVNTDSGTGGFKVSDGGGTTVASIDSTGKISGASLAVPHASTHATGGSDPITPASIGALQPLAQFTGDDVNWPGWGGYAGDPQYLKLYAGTSTTPLTANAPVLRSSAHIAADSTAQGGNTFQWRTRIRPSHTGNWANTASLLLDDAVGAGDHIGVQSHAHANANRVAGGSTSSGNVWAFHGFVSNNGYNSNGIAAELNPYNSDSARSYLDDLPDGAGPNSTGHFMTALQLLPDGSPRNVTRGVAVLGNATTGFDTGIALTGHVSTGIYINSKNTIAYKDAPTNAVPAVKTDIKWGGATSATGIDMSAHTFTGPAIKLGSTHTISDGTITKTLAQLVPPTMSGNTTEAASVSGAKTAGRQVTFDASGNVIASSYDVGATGGGGSGTVSSGTAGQLARYASDGTAVSGWTPDFSTTTLPVSKLKPASNSTSAVQVTKADGTTPVITVDTTNSYVGIGPFANSTTTSPLAPVHIGNGSMWLDKYGSAPAVIGRFANGTQASPTQVLLNNDMYTVAPRPWLSDTSAFAVNTAYMAFTAAENIDSTHKGTFIRFVTTPAGSTTVGERMRIQLGLSVGTTVDFGAGTLALQSDTPRLVQIDNGAALSASNPYWGMRPVHTDGLLHWESSADGSAWTDAATLSRGGTFATTTADSAVGLKAKSTTGAIRLTGYHTSVGAGLLGFLDAAETSYGPGSIYASTLNITANTTITGTFATTSTIDGKLPLTVTTATTNTVESPEIMSGMWLNNTATNGAAVQYNLPTAAAGKQRCYRNYTGKTGVLTVQTSASGQYIDVDGANTASGGYVTSGGALGDSACFVGVDATHWLMLTTKGTWTAH